MSQDFDLNFGSPSNGFLIRTDNFSVQFYNSSKAYHAWNIIHVFSFVALKRLLLTHNFKLLDVINSNNLAIITNMVMIGREIDRHIMNQITCTNLSETPIE